jgi:hypothetical protein
MHLRSASVSSQHDATAAPLGLYRSRYRRSCPRISVALGKKFREDPEGGDQETCRGKAGPKFHGQVLRMGIMLVSVSLQALSIFYVVRGVAYRCRLRWLMNRSWHHWGDLPASR